MVSLSSLNPSCYLPHTVSRFVPAALACKPPPSYFSRAYDALTHPFSTTFTGIRTMIETLFGLPFLSLLVIPFYGSWTTSLNFFFFYLTWSTLVLSHPPLRVELIASLGVRTIFYIVPSTFFIAFDALLPSAVEQIKALGADGLPFQRASRSEALRVLRILSFSFLNTLLSVLCQLLIELTLTRLLGFHAALRVTTTLPLPITLLKHLALGFLLREILTYTIHRTLLHESRSRLAHLHANWYHQLTAPFPLSGSYDHPLPYLLHRFLPVYLPAFLCRFHLLTYLIFLAIVSLEETFAYSGYSTVPTNFVLGGIARRTDKHLDGGGQGNYGCVGLIDWVMGTSVGGNLMEDLGDEAEKHDVQERAERAGRRGASGVRKKVDGVVKRRRKQRSAG